MVTDTIAAPCERAQSTHSTISVVAPRLGHGHQQRVGEVEVRAVVGRDARGGERGADPGARLREVATVDRGVVAGAARDEGDSPPTGEEPTELLTQGQQRVEGASDRLRLLGDLVGHDGHDA
ncbi:hypothetical protein LP422_16455 [Janibacter limosus]|uniref:Uncharacterized protein n=1 Tax=Janibacter limosus TaxID=53458 RepID=A0AC61U2C3_9MICO|nr:hypothetical protein [Janibacter limosus]UUZ44149.1 hypothetical protein LP422_16455 [Janibacter limosus]